MELQDYLHKNVALRNIKRFSMETVLHPQDLASHNYGVGTLFYLLCKNANIEVTSEELFFVLQHDFIEVYTGDYNKKIKNKLKVIEKAWATIEKNTVPKNLRCYTDKEIEFILSKDQVIIFKLADALEAFLYCKVEMFSGNRFFENIFLYYKKIVFDLITQLKKLNIATGVEEWI